MTTDSPNVQIARAYLDSLLSHRTDDVRLAPDAKRFENGEDCGWSREAILESLRTGEQYLPLRTIRELRFAEWDDNVTAHYQLDLDLGGERLATSSIAEHFVVRGGEIHAITVVFEPVMG
ncbi:hypothetical protein [Gordonia neofelifaecis]|uniref:3'(2'),5'-bisphosphate nucleotidase cysq n=1 Tax=Gordonia neofelifaecis NRRL B-59395 TaxID=644548 RepID=F1YIB0_9ACTN|nr:hypothetical protein [Gordonia neofelifaecis]EGD55664.1 3'(2'),5'-bisphosphate nucleotidase cysq [Gordonia neofelifaecis NRRL B-59395]